MADGRERTAEEREAARLERQRRRDNGQPSAPDPAPTPTGQAPEPAPTPTGEAPPEPVFVQAREGQPERTITAAPTARPGRARRAPTRRAGVPRRHSWAGRVVAVLALLLAAGLIWFLVELFQPGHGSGHGQVTVEIPPHAGAGQIGDLLERDGVISSSFFFNLRAALAGDRGKLYAGTYHLKLDMSYSQVLQILTAAPPPVRVSNVTITPGETRRQIDGLLRSQRVHGSYLAGTRRSSLLDPGRYGAPRGTSSLEGFLFPDTYQLRAPISISSLVRDQLTEFRRVFGGLNLKYASSRGLTPYDVLIIASIIEKEAATAHDRPLVASVIYNRLHDHIPLGMDSTTRYEFNDYTKPLTVSQLAAQSPYNTRLHAGLPPTPISNPGLAALQAAARPAATNYLYFVVKPCGNGSSVFTSSSAQFQRDVARYQSARARRGGRSPTKC
jgi:uncharacterized YceG family protein